MSQSVPRPSGHCYPPVPDSQRDHLAHRPHGNDVGSAFFRRKLQILSLRRHSLLAPAELGLIDPHTVEDDRQLAGDRNPSARHAAPLRYLHAHARSADHFVLRISSEWAAS